MRPGSSTEGALRVVLLDSIPKWGGGEKWCVEAARALGARGHRVVVACEKGSPLALRAAEAGVETWPARLGRGHGMTTAVRLSRFLTRQGIEAVIANVGRDVWIGAVACKLSGAKLLQRRGIVRPVKPGPMSRWLYARAVQRIIVNSLAIRDRMLDSAAFLDPSRFVLIPNGVDMASLSSGDGARVRAELGLDRETPVAGSIGRLAAMKGHDDLLHAWSLVRCGLPAAVLLIAGEGEEEARLKLIAGELDLEGSVRFLGFRRDVQDLLAAIDLLVLTSVRDEGCSNTLLEAMGHGVPAVVTRCGGLPYVVEDGSTGLVVPIGDREAIAAAAARLLRDAPERRRLGAEARKTVAERYNLVTAADRLEDLLLSLRT